jgi:hypothetical protein
MIERRVRRSTERDEALRLLLEAARERSDVSSIAVVDADGSLVSGAGEPRELAVLEAIAAPVAHGEMFEACRRMTEGTDVLARRIDVEGGEPLYLAALGRRVARMYEVARGVTRIVRAA